MNADTIGEAIYREARLSPLEPADGGAVEVAERLGIETYDQPHALAEATVATWGGRRRIVLRKELQPERANFKAGQMVAREYIQDQNWAASLRSASRGALECEVAAWLVAPTKAFVAEHEEVGSDVGELARAFVITRTTAALRLHEVFGIGVAIICQHKIHRRGRRFAWLTDEQLRELAAKRATKSVRKVRVRDDDKAVALMG